MLLQQELVHSILPRHMANKVVDETLDYVEKKISAHETVFRPLIVANHADVS